MKISDVKVGKEYGAKDSPTSTYGDPRQVKVLEIVVTEEERVRGYGYLAAGNSSTRKVRRVKVEVLDGSAEERSSGWRWDKIKYAKRGATIVIEARQLVGEWSKLRGDILKRQKEEQERIALEERTRDRLIAVGFKPKDFGWGSIRIHTRGKKTLELEFNDSYVEKLLTMLEAK